MTQGLSTSATTGPGRGAPPGDRELRRLLTERERAEEEAARTTARGLRPGSDCPVCDEPMATIPSAPGLRWLRRRPRLLCGCGFGVEPAPNALGWALVMLLALGLAALGGHAVLSALRLHEPWQRAGLMGAGVGCFLAGMALGWHYKGGGDSGVVAARILRWRRRRQGEPDEGGWDPGWVAENLEAVVVAIVLALIIRHFVMEAFVIPTGSMAPTLLGDHVDVACPECGNVFSANKSEGELERPDSPPMYVSTTCPVCLGHVEQEPRYDDVVGGDKILVNKLLYRVRPPRRWEVIVFKFPEKPWKNFIKRLVGLPGETLDVKNGDLWVEGKLERKPDEVQDAMWMPVLDGSRPRKDGHPRWRVLPPPGALDDAPPDPAGRWSLGDGTRLACAPGGPSPWLELQRQPGGEADVRDGYGYNRDSGGNHLVADLRLRARVTAAAGAAVRLAVVEDGRVVSARIPVGPGAVALEVDGAAQAPGRELGPDEQVPPGVPTDVTLAYADDRARVLIGGRCVLTWLDPFAPARTDVRATVRLQVEGAATLERLRVDRDVYYGHNPNRYGFSNGEVRVPERSYFVLGDNSPSSEDGRKWGFLTEDHLIGRAFAVFWPPADVKGIR